MVFSKKDVIGVIMLCCEGLVVECRWLVGFVLIDYGNLIVVGLYLVKFDVV